MFGAPVFGSGVFMKFIDEAHIEVMAGDLRASVDALLAGRLDLAVIEQSIVVVKATAATESLPPHKGYFCSNLSNSSMDAHCCSRTREKSKDSGSTLTSGSGCRRFRSSIRNRRLADRLAAGV